MHYVLVGVGGALGAILRVFLIRCMPTTIGGVPIPVLSVNVMGCFLAGICTMILSLKIPSPRLYYLIVSGFLGGFTTFSAFAIDVGRLYEKHLYVEILTYIIANLLLSVLAFFIGARLTQYWINS